MPLKMDVYYKSSYTMKRYKIFEKQTSMIDLYMHNFDIVFPYGTFNNNLFP